MIDVMRGIAAGWLCAAGLMLTACGTSSTGSSVSAPITVGGSVTGLAPGASIELQDNGGDAVTITADGDFTFSISVAGGSTYAVTVLKQPAGQSCAVTNGSGTAGSVNITNVSVSCSDNTYNVGVTVSGVDAIGLSLEDNGTDSLAVGANGFFNFNKPVASGSPYAVTISSQPVGETCIVANGSGTIVSSNVSNVTVTCSPKRYSISGTVTGLLSGRSLVLEDNGADSTTVSANGPFSFSTTVASGSSYSVTVLTQPTGQSCAVTHGSGVVAGSAVSNVSVACSDKTYSIGVTVSGLTGSGLVLQDNGGDNLSVSANGSFNFATAVASGSTYAVTILSQPTGETCAVSSGSGTVTSANVTGIPVSCVASYTIGGSLSGLSSGTIVLQDNGGGNLSLSANGSFTFAAPIVTGGAYAVTILTQPQGRTCSVQNGSGTVSAANVTNVSVICGNVWLWIDGSDAANASGVYGTLGAASTSNVPGARYFATSQTDASGNMWFFGGQGYDSAGNAGVLNDLWKFNPTAGTWEWVNGSNMMGASGVYGTQGVASTGNVPGARSGAISWVDSSGNLWLFGGEGYDSTGAFGFLNDLWEFKAVTGTWAWVSGSNIADATGAYGTLGVASAMNAPGARNDATSWIDSSGNLWLFGGYGYPASATNGYLNDLWEFNPTAGTWEWVGGSNTDGATGVYGTQGVAASGNVPGSREGALSWTDAAGNMWLFGGAGSAASGSGELNDLWQFNPTAGTWKWINGSNAVNASGVYGTQGVAATGNGPGGRYAPVSWIDASGKLWLFGGAGFDSAGAYGSLNDLWVFNPTSGKWEWVNGANTVGASGVYGTQGVESTSNVPGARYVAVSWTDASGNLWLFGGLGNSASDSGYLNDLWEYVP